jgi:hypothetical protein
MQMMEEADFLIAVTDLEGASSPGIARWQS